MLPAVPPPRPRPSHTCVLDGVQVGVAADAAVRADAPAEAVAAAMIVAKSTVVLLQDARKLLLQWSIAAVDVQDLVRCARIVEHGRDHLGHVLARDLAAKRRRVEPHSP